MNITFLNLDLYWLESDCSTDLNKYRPYELDQHSILCNTANRLEWPQQSVRLWSKELYNRSSLTAEHRQPLSHSRSDHCKPTTYSFVISCSGHHNSVILFLVHKRWSYFYVTVRKYNQTCIGINKNNQSARVMRRNRIWLKYELQGNW